MVRLVLFFQNISKLKREVNVGTKNVTFYFDNSKNKPSNGTHTVIIKGLALLLRSNIQNKLLNVKLTKNQT